MAPTLGYWNLRGLAQHIRLLLAYTGTEYEEKLYNFGPAPDYSKSEWLDVKYSLGLDFPNLPYYIDRDVKLTQCQAITEYIARKNNLVGSTEQERIRIDMTANLAFEHRISFAMLVYSPEFNERKDQFIADLPKKFKEFSDFIGSGQWIAGDKITYVDFIWYELLDIHKMLAPNCLDRFKNLQDYVKRFESLPAIKKYMSSSKFIKYPINGITASWGGR